MFFHETPFDNSPDRPVEDAPVSRATLAGASTFFRGLIAAICIGAPVWVLFYFLVSA